MPKSHRKATGQRPVLPGIRRRALLLLGGGSCCSPDIHVIEKLR
jgi:hypothetical protein